MERGFWWRTGGPNGALGAEFVAKSEPDGYTIYFTKAGVTAV
jgi:hypothetical protein